MRTFYALEHLVVVLYLECGPEIKKATSNHYMADVNTEVVPFIGCYNSSASESKVFPLISFVDGVEVLINHLSNRYFVGRSNFPIHIRLCDCFDTHMRIRT